MRRPWFALIALALAACDDASPPEAPPQPSATPPTVVTAAPPVVHAPKAPVAIEEYFKVRRLGAAKLTFDEKVVVLQSDAGGRPDLWVMPVTGGPARQITHLDGVLHSFALSPVADQLVFEADHGGDELPHLYLTNAAGDAPKDLVADYPAGRRTDFIEWSDDGKKLYFTSSPRDEKYVDLVEYDVHKGKAETLWKASGKLELGDIARDGKRWIVSETLSDADQNLYLVERGKPDTLALLTPHRGEVLYSAWGFTKDDKQIYVTSDEGGEFSALYAMDLAKKTVSEVLKPSWDVEAAGFSRTFKYRWTWTNVDGTRKLVLLDAKSGREVALPPPPAGAGWWPSAFSRTDRYLTAVLRSDTSPPVPYLLDLKEGKALPLADPMPDTLKGRMMVPGNVVHVPSFDGKQVPAFVYRPVSVGGDGPFPAVIDVHGGPTWQSYREFSPLRQYLVSKGYVVLVPNVRGSTGYGKSCTRLDDLDLGGGPLKDVVACKQWLVANAKVAADEVVVLGASYGGYMALAAATFTPDGVRGERRLLRRLRPQEPGRELPGVLGLGGGEHPPEVRRPERPGARAVPARSIAAQLRRPDQAAAARRAGRQGRAGEEGPERPDGRGNQEARRARPLPRARERGARLLAQRELPRGVRCDRPVPRPVHLRRHLGRGAAGGEEVARPEPLRDPQLASGQPAESRSAWAAEGRGRGRDGYCAASGPGPSTGMPGSTTVRPTHGPRCPHGARPRGPGRDSSRPAAAREPGTAQHGRPGAR